jgi:6-methylsalicylate decarboxylase
MTTNNRIDVHHHFIPSIYADSLASMGISEVAGRELPEWNSSISIEMMDRNGIEKSLLSISAPGVHFGDDRAARELARRSNEAAAEYVSLHPNRFGMFAALSLPDVDAALEELTYALDVLHADGVVLLSSHHDGSYLGDPRFDSVLAELDRRKCIVFLHPAIPVIAENSPLDIPVFAMEFTFDTTRAVFNLAYTGALERFPNIRFICAHAGGTVPYLAARFDLLWFQDPALVERAPLGGTAYLRRLYYDTALSANPHALNSLTELVGADHILFGSDFPFAPELATTMQVEGLSTYQGFTTSDRELVERGTALTLFPTLTGRN